MLILGCPAGDLNKNKENHTENAEIKHKISSSNDLIRLLVVVHGFRQIPKHLLYIKDYISPMNSL